MTENQLTLPIEPAHDNGGLFSDHYLDVLLQSDPRWPAAEAQAAAFLSWLHELYAAEGDNLASYNESQLEAHWFRPIFRRLGHLFEVQPSVPGLGHGVKRPDYVFFPGKEAQEKAAAAQGTATYAAEALAAGEVKAWNVPLGKKVKGGGPSFDDQNPSYQIDYYLKTTGLDWGILSNGRRWRLVHGDTSQRLTIYYEVDLLALLERDDPGAMRFFTLFFGQAAFRPDAHGRIFLDDVLRASSEYALALEEDLQDNVYRALEQLMQGFLDLPQNGLDGGDLDSGQLAAVYDNALILLYRLLFIFYAESRELLPVRNHRYREHYSLRDLAHEIARDNVPTAPTSTVNWANLLNLFHIINGDDEALNRDLGVPRYNGGLFSPNLHPFLEEKAVGDQALVRAVDLLARRETGADGGSGATGGGATSGGAVSGGREFVDYRTLGVRQLGSIYEGLLEYRPRLAEEEMVAVREGGREEVWVPAAEGASAAGTTAIIDRRPAGAVYLATDRGERKATGSYYTPDYIVSYIVDNTLGPLVDEIAQRAHQAHDAAANGGERAAAAQSLVDDVLDLKLLDPAMGSGHFLVEATDYLARALATDPIVQRPAADTVIEESAASPNDDGPWGLEDGPGGLEDDVVYWRRRVVERCIYGVDKNPLAVELAKLSLWLTTVAADQPLSFLDHHLQCGDSLVGADVGDLGWAPPVVLGKKAQKALEKQKAGQMNLFEFRLGQQLPAVLGKVLEITGRESDSYETVQAKEAADHAVRQLKAPFEAVADLWTSAYFGNEITPAEYGEALDAIGKPALWEKPAVQRAREIAAERRFFHWHLAFPEVFYDENGQWRREAAGFDAVVGNPPYQLLQPQNIEEAELRYYQQFDVAQYKIDFYHLFLQAGIQLAAQQGLLSFITPSTFLTNNYTVNLRDFILTETNICRIVVIPDGVFQEARVDNAIVVLQRNQDRSDEESHFLEFITARASHAEIEFLSSVEVRQDSFLTTPGHIFTAVSERARWGADEAQTFPLKDIANVNFGMQLRDRSEYPNDVIETLDTSKLSSDYVPCVTGKDVERYALQFNNRYAFFNEKARRGGCWDREVHFADEKLIIRQIGETPIAAYDDRPHCCLNTVFMVTLSEPHYSIKYLLAVINSQYTAQYWRAHFYDYKETFPKIKGTYLLELPIRQIAFTIPADERQRLLEKGRKLYERYCEKDDLACVTGFVDHELDEGRSDVVHDLLAFLAERMMAMNKEKQQRVEDFWLDLEGVADPDAFDTLRHRGKWEASLWKAEACRPYVDEDSRSTRHLDDTLGWNEGCFKAFVKMLVGSVPNLSQLVAVYRQHHPPYAALAGRLAATDRLIDEVVYRLYGLTEEEIAIVESQ